MSFSRCVDKQGSIRTMEYCSVLKRNKLLNHGKICRNFKCINKWKKPGCILCDSNSMTFWKRQDYGDSKKTSGCQGLGAGWGWQEGWDEQTEHRGLWGQWKPSDDTMLVNTCHEVFAQTHRTHSTRVTPRVTGGLGRWCRVCVGNRCPPGRDADGGGGPTLVGGGCSWGISVLPSEFFCDSKPSLKTPVY